MDKPRQIVVRTVVYTETGLFTTRRHTFLHTATLVNTIHEIMDLAIEDHTRKNLRALLDAILKAGPTV